MNLPTVKLECSKCHFKWEATASTVSRGDVYWGSDRWYCPGCDGAPLPVPGEVRPSLTRQKPVIQVRLLQPRGWYLQRNGDGSIGIFSPLGKPNESQRTSEVVYASTNRDLHELLDKLVDHLADVQWLTTWAQAEHLVDNHRLVQEALNALCEDQTQDNSVGVVCAVIEALKEQPK